MSCYQILLNIITGKLTNPNRLNVPKSALFPHDGSFLASLMILVTLGQHGDLIGLPLVSDICDCSDASDNLLVTDFAFRLDQS
ncbi:hypothetical protein TNIN_66981 [Trichonephila inaurata madagascariensis]|uniref:Uncharacterized protein n=1 Tax=Trichonephila inaurata madagascariensis TaxID=2747483 RepID=A0A8X7CNF6_9ARAC|nr:hypothetical protein TNIN_66981 [Trichonephila inaurata madagascariensis]